MSSKNAAAVGLVILAGLVVFVLGWAVADMFTIGVLILTVGGVGLAVLAGDYFLRYTGRRQPPA